MSDNSKASRKADQFPFSELQTVPGGGVGVCCTVSGRPMIPSSNYPRSSVNTRRKTMNKRTHIDEESRWQRIDVAASRFNLSKQGLDQYAKKHGRKRKIGKVALYDTEGIDADLESGE